MNESRDVGDEVSAVGKDPIAEGLVDHRRVWIFSLSAMRITETLLSCGPREGRQATWRLRYPTDDGGCDVEIVSNGWIQVYLE